MRRRDTEGTVQLNEADSDVRVEENKPFQDNQTPIEKGNIRIMGSADDRERKMKREDKMVPRQRIIKENFPSLKKESW